jgi:hypothetical protein
MSLQWSSYAVFVQSIQLLKFLLNDRHIYITLGIRRLHVQSENPPFHRWKFHNQSNRKLSNN